MTPNDGGRAYFADMGISYGDVRKEDVEMLRSMLDVELRKIRYLFPLTGNRSQLAWHASSMVFYPDAQGRMRSAFIKLRWHDGHEREAISFNADGFIGFCGWASSANTLPVVEAFKDWCDLVAMRRQALEFITEDGIEADR